MFDSKIIYCQELLSKYFNFFKLTDFVFLNDGNKVVLFCSFLKANLDFVEFRLIRMFKSCIFRWYIASSSITLRDVSVRSTATNHSGCESIDTAPFSIRVPAHLLLAISVTTSQSDQLLWSTHGFSRSGSCSRRRRRRRISRRWRRRNERQRLRSTWYLGNHARSSL